MLDLDLLASNIAATVARFLTDKMGEYKKSKGTDREVEILKKINIYFGSEKDCYLNLINYGTSGKLIVLLPNVLLRDNFIDGNRVYAIPGQDYYFDYILSETTSSEKKRQ